MEADPFTKENASVTKCNQHILAVLMPPPVLITESMEEFNRFHNALKDELQIVGTVEHLMLNDIAELGWGIRRYRCAKVSLINSAMVPALKKLLRPLVKIPAERVAPRAEGVLLTLDLEAERALDEEAHRLAHQWLVDEDTRKLVFEMLEGNKLDEYAIEAEAMRIVAPELEKFDRLLASHEWRLSKALRSLAEFRGGFGRHLRASVDQVIDGKVLAVEDKSNKSPTTAT